MSETKLLACPFCGGQPMARGGDQGADVYCTECDSAGPYCGTQKQAINLWNRRADAELVEALREVTRHLGDAIEWSDLSAHDNYDEVCAAHERACAILRKREQR